MSETTLSFLINGNKNMDILEGCHGSFKNRAPQLCGALTHTVLSDYGEMLFQGIPTRFGSIWLSHYQMHHQATLSAEANAASFEVMHLLDGDIGFHPEGLASKLSMKQRTWQMLYMPFVANKVTFPAGARLQTLDFHFDMQWLDQLATYYPLLESMLNSTVRRAAATLTPHANPISLHNIELINALFEATRSERDQSLFLERHLTDWIADALDDLHPAQASRSQLSQPELLRIREIIRFMEEKLSEPLHIAGLSKMALMNELKFKSGFKLVTGLPVFQWLIRKRMEKARQLLDERRMPINEIAWACGYDSAAAFNRAFKRLFNQNPSEYRR